MERTGLRLRPRQRESLQVTLASRTSSPRFKDENEYCRFLRDGGQDAVADWDHLARLLTNKESYFFRDKGQMALLREFILPDLIDRNKKSQTLRIWSAGCSTGEEAYSLAMLLDGLRTGLKLRNWKITILGTDINSAALQTARRGIYGSWSFRMVDPMTRHLYFDHVLGSWQISEPCRSAVTFLHSNLATDAYPNRELGIYEMDLILCRNVFIYFEAKAVESALDKFAQTLSDGGYLMTGHVETRGLSVSPLVTRSFPESEVYQKGGPAAKGKSKTLRVSTAPADPAPKRVNDVQNKPELPTPVGNPPLSPLGSERARTLLLRAMAFADAGQYIEAVESCRRLTGESPLMAEPYELLASIAQEQGRNEDAKGLLKQALYLSPETPHYYIALGALYGDEGDDVRAGKMRGIALELLRRMPPDSTVGFLGEVCARECIDHLSGLPGEGV